MGNQHWRKDTKKRLKVVVFLNIKILLTLFILQIQSPVQVIYTPSQWLPHRQKCAQNNKIIGFVPTMGALHAGHLDLIVRSKQASDVTVVSIFVNPTQFNNPLDFENYPVALTTDLQKCEQAGVDFVFAPSIETIYQQNPTMQLFFGEIEQILEGKFRPAHFNGVGLVVSKLFNIIQPQKAFFGQKDLQQVAIVKMLVRDLSFPIQLLIVPTKREQDGLAMSSRNLRLGIQERADSLILFQSLTKAKGLLLQGIPWPKVYTQITHDFEQIGGVSLEYFALVASDSFTEMERFDDTMACSICVAAYLGQIRLIDNITVIA